VTTLARLAILEFQVILFWVWYWDFRSS